MCACMCVNSAGSRICTEETLGQNVKLLLPVVLVVKGGWEEGITNLFCSYVCIPSILFFT